VSSQEYWTSTPGLAPPSISVPETLKMNEPPGMRIMPAGASVAGVVGGMGTMVCSRDFRGVGVATQSGCLVIAAMCCIRALIAGLGSPAVARMAP
jgi:hypothetical protein